MKDIFKEFKPSSWAIDNKTSIYVLTVIILLAGWFTYNSLPKESFPEVVFPQILITTVYPGTAPADMENLVTKPIEKRVKSINGVKKITSTSKQDFSLVNVEFNTNVDVADAKRKVKDEVDKAQRDLPQNLPQAPTVNEIDISQVPIMNVHLSGDYDLNQLKRYADLMKDRIESLREITRVDIVGALDREIQVNVDMYKMEAAHITMRDIESAIQYENMNISGGQLTMDNLKRSITVRGEFKLPRQLEDIIIRGGTGATVFLKDIAEIKDTYKEQESYARLDHKNVLTLNVIKRSGENLINAADQIRVISQELQDNSFPKGLKVTITGDQSNRTRITLHDLINTIIIGFVLVTLILMFFMGVTNAIFVGLAVPISMCIAFIAMPIFGSMLDFKYTLNMVVLFAFLLALGIVVDDAIVVIENTHRIFDNGKMSIKRAAKMATGEVFMPVLSGTLTTLAPFFPLLFWTGVVGKFMFYMPITVIITLSASLIVAYIINPIFAVDFMKPHINDGGHKKLTRSFWITTVVFALIALLSYLADNRGFGNFSIFIYLFFLLNKFVLNDAIYAFQNNVWPKVQNAYSRMLRTLLKGWRPVGLLIMTLILLVGSFVVTSMFNPGVVYFPKSDPNFVYAYVTLPIGTHQSYTDSITRIVENRVYEVVGDNNPIVESVISNVAVGAGDPMSFDVSTSSHLGKVTVAFVQYDKRHGKSTKVYLNKIREAVKGIPGAEIVVEQEQGGPPTGKPVNIEVAGDDFDQLIAASQGLKRYLDSLQIPGVEELKSNLQVNLPEVLVNIDRQRASREGITTAQIGGGLRGQVFGQDNPVKFRDANDEYPIQIRFNKDQRSDMNSLLSQSIIYRDMNMGGRIRSVPLSALADVSYVNTYGAIQRKNQKRVVTISSNVLGGFNGNQVVAAVQAAAATYKAPEGVQINFTGEQEDQKEGSMFLFGALLTSILLIVLILVTQFNSITKPLIILTEIFFSLIGVLLGFVIFRMEFSIVMVGVGIVALAGVVVRNGILLVEFTDILLEEGMELKEAVVEAGRTRMTPVLLTAAATILGLVPLAVGLNMDFVTLFTDFNPHLFFGGDSVAFWGPLSWTMIFGLGFATFLTLILVPAMILIVAKMKGWFNLPYHKPNTD